MLRASRGNRDSRTTFRSSGGKQTRNQTQRVRAGAADRGICVTNATLIAELSGKIWLESRARD